MLWAKFAFICAQAGMTAAVRLPIGEIRTAAAAWAAFSRLAVPMSEAVYAILQPWAIRNQRAST